MIRFETVMGKYIYIVVQGVEYRVYFEENGQWIPIVCQHTAGSNGEQWRHLLNDKEITSKYRVIVPDLPYHGKSLPPESIEWWKQEYRLSRSFLLDFHTEFCRALGLESPVYIGCSMGGSLAPDLALERPDLYKAVIGVEAGLGYGSAADKVASTLNYFNHPRIGNDYKAWTMWGLCAPTSPEKFRRKTIWEYSQNSPCVFKGDLYYYYIDHDMTHGRAQRIDTSRLAVYLLTGEYDASCRIEDTEKLAEQIKGAKFIPMMGIGHFAMSENFETFKAFLMPVLDEIARERNQFP
jgi:pimeloyl-ACP methyl ester carboxylesterase